MIHISIYFNVCIVLELSVYTASSAHERCISQSHSESYDIYHVSAFKLQTPCSLRAHFCRNLAASELIAFSSSTDLARSVIPLNDVVSSIAKTSRRYTRRLFFKSPPSSSSSLKPNLEIPVWNFGWNFCFFPSQWQLALESKENPELRVEVSKRVGIPRMQSWQCRDTLDSSLSRSPARKSVFLISFSVQFIENSFRVSQGHGGLFIHAGNPWECPPLWFIVMV